MNELLKKWKQSVQQVCALIRELKKDSSRQAYRDLKRYILRLLRKIRPRRLKGQVTFGFDDPAVTGEALGVLAWFLPLYGDAVRVTPDFDGQVFLAEGEGKGKIRLFDVLYVILCIRMNKNIMRTYGRLRRQLGGNENE